MKMALLHSHLREREFLSGKIRIPFKLAIKEFSVYQPSRFNKYRFIVLSGQVGLVFSFAFARIGKSLN